MNFGQAIEMMKRGERMSRAGWNGKNMHVRLVKGKYKLLPSERKEPLIDGVASDLFDYAGATRTQMPHLLMHTASGAEVVGWLASQTDMLAEDWGVAP